MNRDVGAFVQWFRQSAPYINAHRGRTFVISVGGEALADPTVAGLVHDVALLNSLGVRVVLVTGARPQIEERLRARGADMRYHGGLRITDDAALACVKEAAGAVRVEIEALLSMGVANSPMAGFRVQVASGNFVTARPLGVRDGVDYAHTGEVRRVDAGAIRERLGAGCVVLALPLGYSPTGEVFNLAAEDVALEIARALRADKLLYLTEGDLFQHDGGEMIREMDLHEASRLSSRLPDTGEAYRLLAGAIRACQAGVRRVHLLNRHVDGCLLQELFTRDGVGTLVAGDNFESIRRATVDDVGGILELIEPLEREGILVWRSREQLETGIGEYIVVERDGMIIACAALCPHVGEQMAELACFAIHEDYRGSQRGDALLRHVERDALRQGVNYLFVLTTRTAHWFQERGFEPASLDALPMERRALYNLKRNSRVFIKELKTSAVLPAVL
ncbi:MAG: amino-acid N-acetyltransferase [Aquisalimonadaceae bacterium]